MSYTPDRIHVIPLSDLYSHYAQESCWCHPTEIEPAVWAHNAQDCREAQERQTGEQCSDGWIHVMERVPSGAPDPRPTRWNRFLCFWNGHEPENPVNVGWYCGRCGRDLEYGEVSADPLKVRIKDRIRRLASWFEKCEDCGKRFGRHDYNEPHCPF